jgi:hypothetical protein
MDLFSSGRNLQLSTYCIPNTDLPWHRLDMEAMLEAMVADRGEREGDGVPLRAIYCHMLVLF